MSCFSNLLIVISQLHPIVLSTFHLTFLSVTASSSFFHALFVFLSNIEENEGPFFYNQVVHGFKDMGKSNQ